MNPRRRYPTILHNGQEVSIGDVTDNETEVAEKRARERRAAAAAAARSRGEYVPSSRTILNGHLAAMTLAQAGLTADVVPYTEGIYQVRPAGPMNPDTVVAVLAPHFEARLADGIMWVKASETLNPPPPAPTTDRPF